MTSLTLSGAAVQAGESQAAAPWRIAIVGCGPRGMYCLERLLAELHRTPARRPVTVTIYDPAEEPGAGPVYDAASPSYLRMNYAARQVDARPADDPSHPAQLLPFVDWLACYAPEHADAHAYVPRSLVGRYLNWCFRRVVSRVPPRVRIERQRGQVTALHPAGGCWETIAGPVATRFDEVVVTVGHEGWRPISDATANDTWPGSGVRYLNRLFPIDAKLDEAAPPGATIVTRGFALTWIDACLALTEGRGGQFCSDGNHSRYLASGREPACILPWSRTGRPMLAKVDGRRVNLPKLLDNIWSKHERSLQRTRRGEEPVDFVDDVWPVVLTAADDALGALGLRGSAACWFRQWLNGPRRASEANCYMRHSYLSATGQRPLDAGWALGEAWRRLYPALVEVVSYGGLTVASWPRFRRIAREMERIAFGPPAENVGRILALIDVGLIDLSLLGRQGSGVGARPTGGQTPVVALETRIPGCADVRPGSIVAQLLADGSIYRSGVAGGIMIDGAGRPLDRRGNPTAGLAVLGRITEGWILGNDSLSRRLHSHPARWAEAVAKRLVHSRIG